MNSTPVKRALISVFTKEPFKKLVEYLHANDVELISTGGTGNALTEWGLTWTPVEKLTGFPEVFGGRVKTLHPGVFGGLLQREQDVEEAERVGIAPIEMAVIELYPFNETVRAGKDHLACIEKIDIGGVSLIRAASKNHAQVLVVSHAGQIDSVLTHIKENQGSTPEFRKAMAIQGFQHTSSYDTHIYRWLSMSEIPESSFSEGPIQSLRYGENPHQRGFFAGNLHRIFNQISGKELSYNNLLDLDAAWQLLQEKEGPNTAILKHNTPCGGSIHSQAKLAWDQALSGDPISAFGGIILTKHTVDLTWARQLDELFFEILIAPEFSSDALEILTKKKNRIVLQWNRDAVSPRFSERSILGGRLIQEVDTLDSRPEHWDMSHCIEISPSVLSDMKLARILVKHAKSNAIVLVKNGFMLGLGSGQVSRVDAVRQAIEKAHRFSHDLQGAVLASDAFFPFSDGVELAAEAGIKWVWQPGGSVRDAEVISRAAALGVQMVLGGSRHFRH